MHSLEYLIRINSPEQRIPHPLRLHPRIYDLRRHVRSMEVSNEYASRLYAALYKYADQIIERPIYGPEEGWDDLEALKQVTLGDWMEESIMAKGLHRSETER